MQYPGDSLATCSKKWRSHFGFVEDGRPRHFTTIPAYQPRAAPFETVKIYSLVFKVQVCRVELFDTLRFYANFHLCDKTVCPSPH
jgi:hypothetical protein